MFLDFLWQMGAEQMTMKEAMKKMKEQTAQMALNAQQDAEAAAAEREAAESELGLTRQALEAEQNKVKSVEVLYRMLLIYPCVHTLRILRVADETTNSTAHSRPAQPSPAQPSPAQPSPAQPSPAQPSPAQQVCVHAEPAASHAAEHSHASSQCVCACTTISVMTAVYVQSQVQYVAKKENKSLRFAAVITRAF